MSEQKFCQSCGMPLNGSKDLFGTEADGGVNEDYCVYCYKDGQFTFTGDMNAMAEICIPHLVASHPGMNEEAARAIMQNTLPNLKRWREISLDNIEKKCDDLLEKCPLVTLASVSEEGYPRPCILVKVHADGFRKIYVATGSSSRKTAQFRSNPKAGLSFGTGSNGASLTGTVRILDDPQERTRYWQNWMIAHFPGGMNDPEFCVLEFTAKEAVFYIDKIFDTKKY